MQISPEDRSSTNTTTHKNPTAKFIALVIAMCILGGLGYYLLEQQNTIEPIAKHMPTEDIPPAISPPPTQEIPESKPKAEIPEKVVTKPAPNYVLPTLDDSDTAAIKQLDQLTPQNKFSNWFHPEYLIRRGVTFIDGLSRGLQLNKMLKAPTPKGQFLAVKEGNKYWLNPKNYQRYDYLATTIESINNNQLIQAFHLFRPLLEEAYGELGYPPQELDSALIAALDQILAAPFSKGPVELTRDSVQYKYADPKLEALTPIQKQLLRMGPQHTQAIQDKAAFLREALLKKP
jgi:hypothetical protein